MKEKAHQNLAVLKQGISLLSGLEAGLYRHQVGPVFKGTLGGHFRHILDHYSLFFTGLTSGRIDYSARVRDVTIESDPKRAIEASGSVCEQLEVLAAKGLDERVLVLLDGVGDPDRPEWADSSLARELEFLLSHTVHHQALVAIMCRLMGVDIPDDFGMAPSTLRHWRSTGLCAP